MFSACSSKSRGRVKQASTWRHHRWVTAVCSMDDDGW